MHPLLRRARAEGHPLLDGERVTFLWQGRTAPRLAGDFTHWGPLGDNALELERIAPGLWARTLTFPADSYLEYACVRNGQRVRDPLNPRVVSNGVGDFNHWFALPAYAPTSLARRAKGAASGALTSDVLAAPQLLSGGQRRVHFYQPPARKPVPLVVVFDGRDYLRRARLPVIVDNLIAQRRIQPIALALVENAGAQHRRIEYGCNDLTLRFLTDGLIPAARARLSLIDVEREPGAYGIMGASMGGLMATYSALRAPHLFGRVLSQSGAFTLDGLRFNLWDLLRALPAPSLQLYLDVGRYERFLDCNREMRKLLAARGYSVTYREFNAGHNYPAWRDNVARGFEVLFGI